MAHVEPDLMDLRIERLNRLFQLLRNLVWAAGLLLTATVFIAALAWSHFTSDFVRYNSPFVLKPDGTGNKSYYLQLVNATDLGQTEWTVGAIENKPYWWIIAPSVSHVDSLNAL